MKASLRQRKDRCCVCLDDLTVVPINAPHDYRGGRHCCPQCNCFMCGVCQVQYVTVRRSRACPICGSRMHIIPASEVDQLAVKFALMIGRLEQLVICINDDETTEVARARAATRLLAMLHRHRDRLLYPQSALLPIVSLQYDELARKYTWGSALRHRAIALGLM